MDNWSFVSWDLTAKTTEGPMLKRQLALWLNTETDDEAQEVWRCLPPSNRREVAECFARLLGRAAKISASTEEQDERQQ